VGGGVLPHLQVPWAKELLAITQVTRDPRRSNSFFSKPMLSLDGVRATQTMTAVLYLVAVSKKPVLPSNSRRAWRAGPRSATATLPGASSQLKRAQDPSRSAAAARSRIEPREGRVDVVGVVELQGAAAPSWSEAGLRDSVRFWDIGRAG